MRRRAFSSPLALLLVLVLAASSSPFADAYDEDGAQCESHVYPLDGSTIKAVR